MLTTSTSAGPELALSRSRRTRSDMACVNARLISAAVDERCRADSEALLVSVTLPGGFPGCAE